jgi:aromatic-L-amino-acid/L-tryptophan decarboxylase
MALTSGSREGALLRAADIVARAWRSFDAPRPGQPATSADTVRMTGEPLPASPSDAFTALDLAEQVLDESLSQSRPRYFAFIGSSGLEVAVLGDLLAACHDVNMAVTAHAADLVEAQTARWVGDFIGYPAAAGYCTSGGMVSNLTALNAARERALPGARADGMAGRKAAVYVGAEAHASVTRAAEVIGIGAANVRRIPVDAAHRMQVDALRAALVADREAGVSPVAVVATAGTTLTGAVDPLAAVADVCAEHGVWLHVDGAYGAPAASTRTAGPLFEGLARADSVSVDAHKWMYVPKACSWLLVRDGASLGAAFAHESAYMLHDDEAPEPHAVDNTLEYSRPFRALKLWLALRVHGADAFREAIERNLDEARLLADLVQEAPDLELLCDPMLSVVPFRHLPRSGDVDAHNRRLVSALQEDGSFWVSDAVVDGKACLRPCFSNYRTREEDVRALVDEVRAIGERLQAG